MKLHRFMLMGPWICLAVLPQLDRSLISASFPLILCPFSFPPLSSSRSPHYYCQISLIMKYCYCMTALVGRWGNKALKLLITTKKKGARDLGFQLSRAPTTMITVPAATTGTVCDVCVRVFVCRAFLPVCWWGN